MSPASLLSACLAFAALPLFAAGEESAPKTVELFPIPPVEWEEEVWSGEENQQPVNGWKLAREKGLPFYGRCVLYAEKDGQRVLLQSSGDGVYLLGTVGDYWLLGRDSFSVVYVPKDGRKPREVWSGNPMECHEGYLDVESAALQGDGLDVVLVVRPWNTDDDAVLERRSIHIPLDSPTELDVGSTRGVDLPGMGIEHLPVTRVSQDGRWVSVSNGESYMACAVDVERQMASPVLNAEVDVVCGGWVCSYIVGVAWGTDDCPAPRFLKIAGSWYGYQPVSGVWCDESADVEEADKGCYHFHVDYTRPDGATLGEFVAPRADGAEVRFSIPDTEQVRRYWPIMFMESEHDDFSKGFFGIAEFSLCGDKLLYCGEQVLVTVGPQGVEGEEILLNDEALAAARARFDWKVPPIYNASFTHGGAMVAWFVAVPEGEGIAGRWHVRFYAQDGSIRRESVYDVPELPAGLNPMSNDFLTPQVVGDCAVIVTNSDGQGVHYRILSPSDERDDVLLRSPKQLWLIKAGHWLLGITRGGKNYPENENITPSRVHFIPVEI